MSPQERLALLEWALHALSDASKGKLLTVVKTGKLYLPPSENKGELANVTLGNLRLMTVYM